MKDQIMRNTIVSASTKVRQLFKTQTDDVEVTTEGGLAPFDLAEQELRITAALAAFDDLVAEIDGAAVEGQTLLVDGRVFIDLADSSENVELATAA